LDVQTWRLRLGEHSAAYGFNQIASTMAELEQSSGHDGAAKDRVGTRYPRASALLTIRILASCEDFFLRCAGQPLLGAVGYKVEPQIAQTSQIKAQIRIQRSAPRELRQNKCANWRSGCALPVMAGAGPQAPT
jgi:hypothetical protein